MAHVTTARILADKALQKTCGQECVDWAISMLEEGHEGEYVCRLAAMQPLFNHFQLADLRDRALVELRVPDLSPSVALRRYAVELLNAGLSSDAQLTEALGTVKDLCIASDHQRDLYDFYLLYFAHSDLQESETQFYWTGATRKNVLEIIRKRAEAFVREEHPNANECVEM